MDESRGERKRGEIEWRGEEQDKVGSGKEM